MEVTLVNQEEMVITVKMKILAIVFKYYLLAAMNQQILAHRSKKNIMKVTCSKKKKLQMTGNLYSTRENKLKKMKKKTVQTSKVFNEIKK